MCQGVIYRGKHARSQGELAKLLGDGDWKRGKKLIVIASDYNHGFQFSTCCCSVQMTQTAKNVGCDAVSDNFNFEFVPHPATGQSEGIGEKE